MRLYRRPGTKVWQCYYFDAAAGCSRRRSTKCTDRAAAHARAVQWERDGADPDGAAASSYTLGEALDDVIAEYEEMARAGRKAKATTEFYRKRCGQLLRMAKDGVLPRLLADLRSVHVDELIRVRRAEGSSESTISKDLIPLRLALVLAKRREKWRGDVEAIMPARFSPAYQPRLRRLTPAGLLALCAHLPTHRAAWVAWAVATGANLSEAQKACREDARMHHGVRVVHVRGTKRESRDRLVPIVYPWQHALLDAALSALPREGRLFTGWTKIDRDLKAAAKRAELEPLSSNDLRRTFGSWMRASGARPTDIGEAMGHTDSRMAEQVYAHLNVEELAALLAPPATVPDTCNDSSDGADSADPVDGAAERICRDFGSDCWTRTSDPVINSHQESGAVSGTCRHMCATDSPGMRGLAKAVRSLASDWDALELALAQLDDAAS